MYETLLLFSCTFFILSLLTVFGSLSVKADTVLTFLFEKSAEDSYASDDNCSGGTVTGYQTIISSDFHFSSQLYDEVKQQSSYLGKNWTSFKAGAKACTRQDVHLEAFVLTRQDLQYIGPEMKPVFEPGEFEIMVGASSRDEDLLKQTINIDK